MRVLLYLAGVSQDEHALWCNSLELKFTPRVAPLDVGLEVPLLTISNVTINAVKLFDTIMCLYVSL